MLEQHLFPAAAPAAGDPAGPLTFHEATRAFQRRYIQECLEANGWNVAATSRQLDVARSHLYSLLRPEQTAKG